MRQIARYSIGMLVAGTLGLSTATYARDLTIVSWGGAFQDAQREINFKPFSELIGKPVLDNSWDGGIGVLQAKALAGVPNWDVVEIEGDELILGCADGLYEELDWEQLGGRDKYIDVSVHDCGIGNIVYSSGIAYDGERLEVTSGPTSWVDFWDVEKFPGNRALRRGPKYTLEYALLADGVAPENIYEELRSEAGIERAFNKLDEIKPYLLWWDSPAQSLQLLVSGQVIMASQFNGRITTLNQTENKQFEFVWPGSIYTLDYWAILKDSPNKEDAMKFIVYSSLPEVQAKLPAYIAYGTTAKAAADLVPEQYQKLLPTYPENMEVAMPMDISFWVDEIEPLTQRFDAWLAR